MLDTKIIKQINDFVYAKPRTIQELALFLKINWRTADRYVSKIIEESGSLSCKTFREGTRGALKVVYWNNIERIHSSEFQKRLLMQIEAGKNKEDFSPFEIYQYVDANKKQAKILTKEQYNSKENFESFAGLLGSAQSQILFLSGNLTFSNMSSHDQKIRQIVEDLAEKNISSKILARVEIPGLDNIKNVLAINDRTGKNMVEVRHCFQHLRLTIIDNKVAMLKEIKDPANYSKDELKEWIAILYYIYDEEWIEWLQKVFWNLFRVSVDAQKRVEDIEGMQKF